MNAKFIALTLTLVLVTGVGGAQTADTAKAHPGQLTGDNVYVRSGPGMNNYFVSSLSAPDKVEIVREADGWMTIKAVDGCYSVVSKEYVDTTDGKTGTITRDNVWVRAGGKLHDKPSWHDYGLIQTSLNRGDKVTIIGTGGDHYRIVPPKDAYFYIAAKYVERLPNGATSADDSPETPTTTTQPAPTPQPFRVTGTAAERQALEAIQAVDKQLTAEVKKPLDQQDLEGLMARYKAIEVPKDSYLNKFIGQRIGYLETAIKNRKDQREIELIKQRMKEQQAEYDKERSEIEVKEPATQPVIQYTAEGILVPSVLFPGTGSVPKRYAVRDPQTNRTMAYVQCTTGDVALEEYVNKYVGIHGQATYNKPLKLSIVEAEEIVVLDENAKLPEAPEPVVGPMPKPPAPKPAAVVPGPKVAPKSEPKAEPKTESKTEPAVIEPQSPPTPEPISEPKSEPMTVEPVSEPEPAVIEPAPGPMPEPVAEPSPGPMPKPEEEPAPGPMPKPEEEPAPGPMPTPVEEPSPGPMPKPVAEPAPGPMPAPVKEPAPEPATPEPVSEPKSEPTVIAPAQSPQSDPVVIEPKPAPQPEPKPEPAPPAPKPEAVVNLESLEVDVTPGQQEKPAPKETPVEPKPMFDLPPEPVAPGESAAENKSKPPIEPTLTTRPASITIQPLPETGLETVKPTTQPTVTPLSEEEYK